MFARLLMASLMGIALLTIPVSRSSADGFRFPDFAAAGGHYDPGPFGMSNPDANHPFHMGDMPDLRADGKGVALFERVTSRVTIAPGPLSLFDTNGSSVIVHLNEDHGTTGVAGGSGGPRIACGVVETID
jgi:Cu-Zn family superoxide dismutase